MPSTKELEQVAINQSYVTAISNVMDVFLTAMIVAGNDPTEQRQAHDRFVIGIRLCREARAIWNEVISTP